MSDKFVNFFMVILIILLTLLVFFIVGGICIASTIFIFSISVKTAALIWLAILFPFSTIIIVIMMFLTEKSEFE